MSVLFAVVLSVAVVEPVVRLPFNRCVDRVSSILPRVGRLVLKAEASEHWKQKAMMAYAGQMFRQTLFLAALLTIVAVGAFLIAWAATFAAPDFVTFLFSPLGIGLTAVFASLYGLIRRRATHV